MNKTAVFPGSFDPPTLGHLDLVDRALELFDQVVVAIGINMAKRGFLTVDERAAVLHECLDGRERVTVRTFEGLIAPWCAREGLGPIVRGVRNAVDFEYERSMAIHNRALAPSVDTVFLMPSPELTFTSSTLIREIVAGGGDASPWLPEPALRAMQRALAKRETTKR
ncbi:MAG: pantetheine-phosphate adenylyltransferase [Planctomycetes bacterium]|nr:pantetheine-phosphate adenylyltransferase [Planctomycetota bacterium]